MKIAIEGCCHGELDSIYASIAKAEQQGNFKTDLLLICGDFQALRNTADFECLAVPAKYRQLGSFHKYYSGEKTAPLLTIVIGGNHEASNYMWELAHGGWLAPNIYFLGEAGAVEVGGIKIAGISGIYGSHDYNRGRDEKMPYDRSAIRSIYHTRIFDVWRLKLLMGQSTSNQPDIVLSHDWPNTIEQHGDAADLIRRKPFFKNEIETGTLGSPPLLELLKVLRPRYWFSAHLHVKFAALFKHDGQQTTVSGSDSSTQSKSVSVGNAAASSTPLANPEALEIDDVDFDEAADATEIRATAGNPDEIAIEDFDSESGEPIDEDPPHDHIDEPDGNVQPNQPALNSDSNEQTRFLSLSKCLPSHEFLQFIDVDAPQFDQQQEQEGSETTDQGTMPSSARRPSPTLAFSPRWLAILKATNEMMSLQRHQPPLPRTDDPELLERIAKEETWILQNLTQGNGIDQAARATSILPIETVQRFIPTAPTSTQAGMHHRGPPPWYTNKQTEALAQWLQMDNKINPPPVMPGQAFHPAGLPPRMSGPPRAFNGPPMAPTSGSSMTEEEEIRSIEEAAQRARKRAKDMTSSDGIDEGFARSGAGPSSSGVDHDESEPVTLEEDESIDARWKEGTG